MSIRMDDNRVTVICPNLKCARPNSVPLSARGKAMRCPFCNTAFRVPESGPDTEQESNAGKKKN